jgi:cell division transport system permease protein
MTRLVASLRFVVVSAVQNFLRNLGVSLAAVSTMSLILVLVGGAVLGTHMLSQALTSEEEHASKIKVYIQDGVSLASITNLADRFRADPRVAAVHFESKDEAIKEARDHQGLGSALDALDANPLPASLNLDLRHLSDPQAIDTLARHQAIVEGGDHATDYNPDVIPKLQRVIRWVWIGAVAIAMVLGAISLVIIMNTIRTAVFVRRREIEIMKLVGAADWFVRWPFILEGMLGGILAAGIAAAVVALVYHPLVANLRSDLFFFPLAYDGGFLAVLVIWLGVGGMALGAFGSYLGVRRFLGV